MLALGIWAFVALVIGVIYPAVLQVLKVDPAQSTLELPYIQRNINATRAAYDLNDVSPDPSPAPPRSPRQAVAPTLPTLNNIRLWDPDPTISLPTFQKLQDIRGYYTSSTADRRRPLRRRRDA